MRVSAARAREFVAAALERRGVPAAGAATVAECLIDAELEGQAAHGLMRLPFLLRRLDAGLINPDPRLRVLEDRPGTALLDAGNGLGPIAGVAAMEIAVFKARNAGCAAVAVRRSNHLGAVGFYVKRGAAAGVVALGFSNTPPALAPPGGRTPLLGTNPIACAFPASGAPLVIDMSTSQVARGRILSARAAGRPLSPGWALDAEGRETLDPEAALAGSLAPLGGPKGFALALLVEVLAGVLSGSAVGPEVTGTFAPSERPSDVGHCFLAIDPEAFGGGFAERLDRLAAAVRAVPPVDPAVPVRVPGDRRQRERERHTVAGIQVDERLAGELEELAGRPLAPA